MKESEILKTSDKAIWRDSKMCQKVKKKNFYVIWPVFCWMFSEKVHGVKHHRNIAFRSLLSAEESPDRNIYREINWIRVMSDDPDHGPWPWQCWWLQQRWWPCGVSDHGHVSGGNQSRLLVETLSVSKWSRAELTSHLGWSRAESYMDLSRRKEEQKFGGESGISSMWQTSQQEQTSTLEL